MDADLQRAWRFEDAIRVRCATRVEPFPWGTALFNDDFPRVWDMNFLRVDRPDGAEVDQLISESDRLLGGSGLSHRQIEVLGAPGARLAPHFLERNWTAFRALYMGLARPPDHRAPEGIAKEVTWEQVRPADELQTKREPHGKDPEVVRQITDQFKVIANATHMRCFGAFAGETVVSYCFLYSDGVVAQVETVGTIEEYRKRGLSRAVMQAAIDVAQDEAHEMIFVVADADDWPKDFYAKLGFEPLGTTYSFRRELAGSPPPGEYL